MVKPTLTEPEFLTSREFEPSRQSNAKAFLLSMAQTLPEHKKKTASFGITKIEISWRAGDISIVRVIDEVTHKFE